MPALAPLESSELVIAPVPPGEVEFGGGVEIIVVGITEVDNEVTTGGEDDAGTEVVIEIVKLVGGALPSVCVIIVEIAVVVVRMEVRVAEEILVTVVGGSTETMVVVIDVGGSVDFEESDDLLLPPSSLLLLSAQVRIHNLDGEDFGKRTVLVFIAISIVPIVSIVSLVTALLFGAVSSSAAVVPVAIVSITVVAPSVAPIVSKFKWKQIIVDIVQGHSILRAIPWVSLSCHPIV